MTHQTARSTLGVTGPSARLLPERSQPLAQLLHLGQGLLRPNTLRLCTLLLPVAALVFLIGSLALLLRTTVLLLRATVLLLGLFGVLFKLEERLAVGADDSQTLVAHLEAHLQ